MFQLRKFSGPLQMIGVPRRRAAAAAGTAMLAAATVLAGTAPAGAASPPGPGLAFTPANGDYGPIAVDTTTVNDFTLANQGGTATGALTLTLFGEGSGAFTIAADTCRKTSLGPGESCRFKVKFHPISATSYTVTLTATSRRPGVTATLALTGTGVGRHLYWADSDAGTITEAGLDGSNPQVIAAGQSNPVGVAVDSTHLYWADSNTGTIGRPAWTAATRTSSPPGKASRSGWRSTAPTCTGPTPPLVRPSGRSWRPAWTAATRTSSPPGYAARTR